MKWRYQPFLFFKLGWLMFFIASSCVDRPHQEYLVSGTTMGSIVYNVKYMAVDEQVDKVQVDEVLEAFNQSLSVYIPDSEISQLNTTGSLDFQSGYFYPVLVSSQEIFDKTGGTFDPTIGPLIDAWGFGPNKQIPEMDSVTVDSLLGLVGFSKVTFDSLQVEMPVEFSMDFGAIAKGYAVDVVGELLESNAIVDYLVEIGGEVRCRGENKENKSWSLGIEDPTVNVNEQRILAVVRLKNLSLATSGNYRNHYIKDGQTFAHIVDPRTGYTAQHKLLSASVFAEDCMTADAYATSLMVVGLEEAKNIIDNESIDAILFYEDNEGTLQSFVSEGIKPFVELNKVN